MKESICGSVQVESLRNASLLPLSGPCVKSVLYYYLEVIRMVASF